jgi:anion-transporting  ArsA/GET3 family ATPase
MRDDAEVSGVVLLREMQALDLSRTDGSAALVRLVREKRVLVSVGAGGVGKTTVAASLGLLAAQQGRRSLVMTIDPARRLAVSLGLDSLEHQPKLVPEEKMRAVGLPPLLQAMVLDPKRTFDEVIARHAPDEATFQRIMQNKLYRELSTRLAGGQEYAAIERLYDAFSASDSDLLVLDTPPTVNAIDFLDAPRRMVALLDGAAVRLFVRSYEQVGRFNFRSLSLGAAYVFKRLARFVGGAFLDDVAQFFADLHTMLGGFRTRAAEVMELLKREDVGFVVVTSALPQAIEEAMLLSDRLLARELRPAAFVINRVHEQGVPALEEAEVVAELRRLDLGDGEARALAAVLLRSAQQMSQLAEADAGQVRRLIDRYGPDVPYLIVPLLPQDVYDVATLARLAGYLGTTHDVG